MRAWEGGESEAPVLTGPSTSPAFGGYWGRGTRPSLNAGTGPGALWKGGEAAPSPTAGWDVAGEGLWSLAQADPPRRGGSRAQVRRRPQDPWRQKGAPGPDQLRVPGSGV